MRPAVAVLEFDSIARGIEAGDAMVKRAPLDAIRAGTVHQGKYVVLVGGLTADVEEAVAAGREVGGGSLVDVVFLPDVHPDVVASIGGTRRMAPAGDALGVIETLTVASAIDAADAGVKGARVVLRDLRMADGLGGKGYALFGGEVAEVEAAVEQGVARIARSGQEVGHVVIPQLHGEMDGELAAEPRWLPRVQGSEKPDDGPPATAGPAPGGRPTPGTGRTLVEARAAAPVPRAPRRARARKG